MSYSVLDKDKKMIVTSLLGKTISGDIIQRAIELTVCGIVFHFLGRVEVSGADVESLWGLAGEVELFEVALHDAVFHWL